MSFIYLIICRDEDGHAVLGLADAVSATSDVSGRVDWKEGQSRVQQLIPTVEAMADGTASVTVRQMHLCLATPYCFTAVLYDSRWW